MAFSPDGRTLASAGEHRFIMLSDVRTGGVRRVIRSQDGAHAFAFSPDGRTLAAAARDRTIRLWDVASGRQLLPALAGNMADVCCIAFSPDGRTIASGGSDDSVRLWDVATHIPLGRPFTGHKDYLRSIAFAPDGRALVSGSEDGTIRIWEVFSWSSYAQLRDEVCHIIGRGIAQSEWVQYVVGIQYPRSCS
jgi:WD40 repeat protein